MNSTNNYSTSVTRTDIGWYCRVFHGENALVQTLVKKREDIGPAIKDLLRTIDKLGGDRFTNAARSRITEEFSVKHEWLVGKDL